MFSYQIQFPPTPTNAADAATSLDERATRILAFLACGSEVDYALNQTKAGEDSTAYLIAKFEWVTGHPDLQGGRHLKLNGQPVVAGSPCTFTRYYQPKELCSFVETEQQCTDGNKLKDAEAVEWRAILTQELQAHFKEKFIAQFPQCAGFLPSLTVLVGTGAAPPTAAVGADTFRVDFQIPHECLVAQINSSLEKMTVIGNMGTDKSPCNVFGENIGDWDVPVRNFTRLAFLNARNGRNQAAPEIIHAAALKNLQEQLLTADGGPADEKYAVADCGNTEDSTGSSQERADEKDWTDEPFWQTIGDILWFLLEVIIVIAIIYVAAWLLVGAGVAGIIAGIVGLAITVAGVILFVQSIPETENHLLMINTSKYLKNQIIINEVPDSDGTNRYRKDQAAVKDWLMVKMQSILKNDLVEYNSRPYNRYSTMAIQNIADFADDDDLRMGARIVLDYLHAKFVVGSQQGRRFLPFRRKREAMAGFIDVDAPNNNGLFDLIHAGDHQIGLNLFYAGQLDQMRDDFVSFGAGGQDIFAVTSGYQPADFVLDLAFDKSTPLFQRIHHASAEIYSSGMGFLISAGGMTTDYAYSFAGLGKDDDKGVAMPTTLFLPKSATDEPVDKNKPSVSRTTLNELIRIDGMRTAKPNDNPSYDQNVCVWDGFACGVNIVIPPSSPDDPGAGFTTATVLSAEGGPCRTTVAAGPGATWSFIDSRRCPAYHHAPRTFTVIYRQDCPAGALHCEDNFGFFEVVDASPSDDFAHFMAKVIADNPPGFFKISFSVDGPEMNGTYRSARGQVIWCQAFESATRKPRIIAVDGVPQKDWSSWSFAEGSSALKPVVKTPIIATGDGLVTITNTRLNKTLELDFRDKDHPHRNLK